MINFCVKREGKRRHLPSFSPKMYYRLRAILEEEWPTHNIGSCFDLPFKAEHIIKFRENGVYVRVRIKKNDLFCHWR